MKQPKGLKLKTKRGKNNILQFKTVPEEREYFLGALNKLNAVSPILQFTISDFLRMATQDLSERILKEEIVLKLNIPERQIIFDLVKTKKVIQQ